MSAPQNPEFNQAAFQQLLDLIPAWMKLLLVFIIQGAKSTFFAARDTVVATLCAWLLPKIVVFGYYAPAGLVFALVHLYLFLQDQPSWRRVAIDGRRFISRDDADDDLLTSIYLNSMDLGIYVFMSLVFRNMGSIWRFFKATLLSGYPVLSFIGMASMMWFIMIDNPRESFNTEVARLWNFVAPTIFGILTRIGQLLLKATRQCVRFYLACYSFTVAQRDKSTVRIAAKLGKFEYSTLGDGEVRLLKLSKLTIWSPARCELIHVKLDQAPAFETISYTWGAIRSHKALILNGKRLDVSERVYEIVHDRASALMTRHIWIDSICINQGDDGEKSSQVQLMRNIYGSSYHTIVWLGHADDANEAIGFLAHLRRRMDFDNAAERAARPLNELNIENPFWPALCNMIRHDYWERCWVIQEIAVSRKVILSYGGELITWDYFASMMKALFHENPNTLWHISKIYWRSLDPPPMDAGLQISTLVRVREGIQSHRSLALFDLLTASINSVATDPRDNIFAVQGISNAADTRELMPDYSSSVSQPFLVTAKYLLQQESRSRILHLAGIGFYRNPDLSASWVPDWSRKRLAKMFWVRPEELPYRASGTIDQEPYMLLGADGLTLSLQGIRVDTIQEAGPQFFGISENGVPKASLFPGSFVHYAASRDMALRSGRNEPYPTGVSLREAFWRTLIGDRGPSGSWPADASFATNYGELERFCEALISVLPDQNQQNQEIGSEVLENMNGVDFGDVVEMGRFANVSGPHTRERRFVVTERGYMGMAPPYSEVGDVLFIIPGAYVPFLFRWQQETENWKLVGESYIYGMMDGEMMNEGVDLQELQVC